MCLLRAKTRLGSPSRIRRYYSSILIKRFNYLVSLLLHLYWSIWIKGERSGDLCQTEKKTVVRNTGSLARGDPFIRFSLRAAAVNPESSVIDVFPSVSKCGPFRWCFAEREGPATRVAEVAHLPRPRQFLPLIKNLRIFSNPEQTIPRKSSRVRRPGMVTRSTRSLGLTIAAARERNYSSYSGYRRRRVLGVPGVDGVDGADGADGMARG